jgi:hypothetical protein
MSVRSVIILIDLSLQYDLTNALQGVDRELVNYPTLRAWPTVLTG